ncbi:helix-turn-helix transcriptional regulator [Streptomyces sp. NPDC050738]|uniref:helix-turn-helix transcriptional regulator n=1 Tax=Streptomyces sp. NPDC050738 TaxID=3154744 RepID=UPI003414AC30
MTLSTSASDIISPLTFHGRREERDAVDGLVRRLRTGLGGVLALAAHPGLGRTALVQYAQAICAPLPSITLTAPARLPGEGPLLVCIDDAHTWEPSERSALVAGLHRMTTERPVAVLLTIAEHAPGAEEFTALPTLRLGPLDHTATAALFDRLGGALADPLVKALLIREAEGNPRLLAAYITHLTPGQLAGRSPLPDSLSGGEDVLDAYAVRVDALPRAARALLLLAAAAVEHEADGVGADLALLLRTGADPEGLAPAVAAGVVVRAGGRIRFTHPLLRRAVLHRAPLESRRRAHAGLAEVCGDGLPRLVQLACTAGEYDAALAAALAATASRPRPYAECSDALARAAALTADPALRTDRLAEAAEAARRAGDPVRARALLARTGATPGHGGAHRVRGLLALADGPAADAREALLTAASLLPPEPARRALLGAAEAAWAMGDATAYMEAMTRARADTDDPSLEAYCDGMCAMLTGRIEAGHALLRRCLDDVPRTGDPAVLLRAGAAALVVGEVETACAAGARALAAVGAYGPEVLLPRALEHLAYGELRAGRHTRARAHALEGLRAAHRIGQPNVAVALHAVLALAASVEGDAVACSVHAEAASAGAGPHDLTQAALLAAWAVARADLAAGRPADAAARLGPLVAPGPRSGHFAVRMLAVPCFVEAAVQSGRPAEARRATEEFALWTAATADRLAPAQLARCRALLAPPQSAAAAYESALAHHDRMPGEFERARTQLLYGQWLRRRRRTRMARAPLRDALVSFERCGARAWADRTRGELRAAGEAVAGEPDPGPLEVLTPQQQRIARHVAEGATNREVAARLSLSHRTVDHHLRNVFSALGVRSRVELSRLLVGGRRMAGP